MLGLYLYQIYLDKQDLLLHNRVSDSERSASSFLNNEEVIHINEMHEMPWKELAILD